MSLNRSLTVLMSLVAVIALTAALSLVLLTTYAHRSALHLQDSLNQVRVAQEMQVGLLNYVRMNDPPFLHGMEDGLRQKISEARTLFTEEDEIAALREASVSIETYFLNPRDDSHSQENLEAALTALESLVVINVGQADKAAQEVAHWERMGNWIGGSSGTLLVLGIAGILIWLRFVALHPVFDICNAMKSFGKGTSNARAADRGPEELRNIAAQFNDMADTLKRQHENELQFLSAVAHDLRNPISALSISAKMLASDQTNKPGLISLIERQIHSLDRMVGDLLDRSRIESGQLELCIAKHDARKIAQDAFDLFSSTSKTHEFVLHLPDSPVPIRCDPVRIEQVLNNLISNAIKYSPDGGDIELGLKENSDNVQFHVTDHGMGIPNEELLHIFEPFRRARSVKEDIPGVGLGLSVVRRIVRAHAGNIEVDSEVGEGTTFRIYLPASH